jgi:diguanylate cyclase (GGDEF)-like protein/PAS domain S-box-containing protein
MRAERLPLRASLKVLRLARTQAEYTSLDIRALSLARAETVAAIAEAKASDARLREAIEILPQGVVFLDKEGRYVLWNKQYADIYKRSADLFKVGVRLEDTLRIGIERGDYPEAKGREEQWLKERLSRLYRPGERHEQWLSDGRCILIEERTTSEGGIIGLRVDITEMKEREASFRLLFDANPVPMFVFARDSKRILAANDAAVEHYGYPRSALLGMDLSDLHDAADHDELEELYGAHSDSYAGRTWKHLTRDGSQIDVAIYSRAVTHERVPAVLFAAVDITERKRAEAQVAYMAHHDALTGLANRVFLRSRMEEILGRLRRGTKGLATLCIDLDNFKGVNDALGHPAGDLLLQYVARRIGETLRDGDIAARLGGDEFAVVLPETVELNEVSAIAQRLIKVIGAPYDIHGHQILVGASIGIALAPSDGEDAVKLLKNADMALYQAKGDGKGAFRYFEPEMNARVQARRRLEMDLRAALANDDLEVHYQPLVDIASGAITGVEALVRWPRGALGAVTPGEFIPVAEEAGLIAPLGAYVLRRACIDAMAWPEHMTVAVNMSPLQFRVGNVQDAVVDALRTSGLSPSRLEVEITETLFLEKSDHVVSTLHALRALGVRIAMDDFGTGYSSLSYLRRFPFDKIKIDQSFVREIYAHVEQQAIVRAIMSLGSSLGMTITAEGIESEAELVFLKAVGCNQGQGYLFSKAVPQAELLKLLAVEKGRRVA